jgi:hypothetical protein
MRRAVAVLGGLVALLGAWAAIVPFAGPAFGYPMPPGSNGDAWQWTASHWQLHVAAGVPALIGGLLLMFGSSSAARLGGVVGMLGGAWAVLGPVP